MSFFYHFALYLTDILACGCIIIDMLFSGRLEQKKAVFCFYCFSLSKIVAFLHGFDVIVYVLVGIIGRRVGCNTVHNLHYMVRFGVKLVDSLRFLYFLIG